MTFEVIDAQVSIGAPDAALARLGVKAGDPVTIALIECLRIPELIFSGVLLSKNATAERHSCRYAFMCWDRIRTGEIPRWECGLCALPHGGLSSLGALAVIEAARGAVHAGKPGIVCLICRTCNDEDVLGRMHKAYRLVPCAEGRA